MAGGSGALGFGSGLAKGLAAGFLRSHQEKRVAEEKKADQERQNHLAMLEFSLKHGSDTGDYSATQQILETLDPDLGKQFKKQGGSPFEHLAPILAAGGQQAPAPDPQGPDAADLPSRQPVGVFVPGPETWSFGGTPLESEGALKERDFNATISARRKAGTAQGLKGEELARYALVGQMPMERVGATGGITSVAGEMPDGSPAYGIFDRRPGSPTFGKYLDADTQEPLLGFQPRTTTGSRTLGADREAIAKELFNLPASRLNAEQMGIVNKKMADFAEQQAKARGTGSGAAKIQTDLKSPIGTTAGIQYNVPPTTTLEQLATTVGLSDAQQTKIATLGQLDGLLDDIESGIKDVFPAVEPGVRGRIHSQFALGMKTLAADEGLAELDAAIQEALANVAKLGGQVGSLSDKDIEGARSTLAELTPRVFKGDTQATALARLGVLRRLLDKAKTTTLKPSGAKAVAAPTTVEAGKPYQDASGNWIIP